MADKNIHIADLQKRYLQAALSGDSSQAKVAIDEALARGIKPKQVYLAILVESQRQVGELWHLRQVSVAGEHLASNITIAEMSRLRELLKRRPSLQRRAVVSCVEGDTHLIGARIVADFLFADGWEVDFLGIDTPAESLSSFVMERKPDLVGLSCASTLTLEKLYKTARLLKVVSPEVKLLVGGQVFVSARPESLPKEIDAIATTIDEACEKARSLVGIPSSATSLDQVLKEIGTRISVNRKARRMSQQQVAEASGLDRAYISAVEHGKHNLTMGALLKLADALEIGIEELVIDNAPGMSVNTKV
jgi:methanogenic corrinoid protein MtbC1/DNA-binding XRE family transcriptional regulator